MYLAHVLRASALLKADLDELLQHSLVTAIRIFTGPGAPLPFAGSCNNDTPFKIYADSGQVGPGHAEVLWAVI